MHHPDKVPEAEKLAAEERFKRLSEAHDLLADPERRELYDRFGIQDPNVLAQDQWDMGEAGMHGFENFEEILKEFFQNAGGAPPEPERLGSQAPEDLQDVWEGILGFTLLSLGAASLACVAWLVRRPPLSGVLSWCWWRCRFLLFDLGFG
ncbi:unnamed protein product [Durusdinium trenchii]|uniref:J domain-containing protein n=1 Tax=Durusdinium trenchii TaxID=1381693 RepID=A0ABP0QPR6_9DINO